MKLRSYSLLAALALVTASFAQSASPKITYTTVAVPINRALAEISKQAGMRLTAAPLVANEVIILSVKGMPLDDVKIQIAKACSAKWEPIEGGEMLIPDLVQRRQEEQKDRAEYVEALSKSLKQLVDSLNPPKPDPKAKADPAGAAMAEQVGWFGGSGASGKAIIKLIQSIGVTNLAAIGERDRVVYSSNPTRMQKPFVGNWGPILAQLVTENNEQIAKRMRDKTEVKEPENEQMKKLREMFGDFDETDKPVEGTPSKAILICARQPMFGGLMLTLRVYNEKGKIVITGNQMLMGGDSMLADIPDMEFGPDGLPREKPKPKTATTEKPIEFSVTTKELNSLSNVMNMAASPTKMSDELRMKLLSPDQYDPLSFTTSEALLATAAQRGKNLVAVMPDKMDSYLAMFMPKSEALTPTQYLESIQDVATVSADGPIILIRPLKPAESRKERIDRVALGAFLKAVDSKGTISLDDLAAYAQRSNSPMEDTSSMTYFMLFAPNAIQSGMGGQVSWDALRFYGSLSATQRKSLSEGTRMSFSQFSPPQAAAVRQLAFGPEENLIAENPDAKKPEFEFPSFIRGALMARLGGDYRSEPTEVMPNGLPGTGFVELKLTQDSIAKPTGNVPAMFGNAVMGADELAMLKMFKDMPGMEQFSAMMPTIEEVRLGERSVYEFKFTVAEGVYLEKTLNDDRLSSKSPVVKMANLPSAFAKKIDDRLAAFKKLPFFDPAFLSPNRGGPPPPAN